MSIGRNVAKLTSGRIAAQAIVFVTAPIIARLFLPEHFGILQIFVSIVSVVGVVTCLRYELSIPLGKDKKEVSASFVLSLFFAFIFTLVTLAVVFVARERVARWFKVPELEMFLWLLPVVVFIGGLQKPLRYYAAREGKFGAMAWSGFASAAGGALVVTAWGLTIGASVTGLFAGYVASALFGVLILLVLSIRKLASDIRNAHLSFGMIWTTAKQHKKFPIFSTWSGLLNTASLQLPPIMLGLYFSTAVVGYYSLGYRLVSLPLGLLSGSIAQVFFPAIAKEYNDTGVLSEIVSNVFKRLVQIGVFPIMVIGLYGSELFRFILGEQWGEAGVYAQILSIVFLVSFVTSPLTALFAVKQCQGQGLVYNVALVSSRLLALSLAGYMRNPRILLGAYAMASSIVYIFTLAWLLRISNVSLRWGGKVMLKYILGTGILLLPMSFFVYRKYSIAVVLGSMAFGAICYMWVLYRTDTGMQIMLHGLLRHEKAIERKNW